MPNKELGPYFKLGNGVPGEQMVFAAAPSEAGNPASVSLSGSQSRKEIICQKRKEGRKSGRRDQDDDGDRDRQWTKISWPGQ